jgi:hypothetical protein
VQYVTRTLKVELDCVCDGIVVFDQEYVFVHA